MRRLDHAEIQEILGAYALDAVDPDEAALVDAHLSDCPRCAAEVAAHREVAASLAHAGSPAPEGLWSRVAARLEDAPPALDLARVTVRTPRRPSRPTRIMAAALAAAAVVMSLLAVQVVRQGERMDRLSAAVERRSLSDAASWALGERQSRRVNLHSDDGRVFVEAVVQANGDGYLVRHNLPPLPGHRTYQLWGRVGARQVSLGVLGPRPGPVSAFRADADLVMLAVTEEPAGGVEAPTRLPLMRGFLLPAQAGPPPTPSQGGTGRAQPERIKSRSNR